MRAGAALGAVRRRRALQNVSLQESVYPADHCMRMAGAGKRVLALRSVLCGGGARFSAFARDAGGEQWRLHDDSGARPAGDWAAVLTQCRLARMQPLVLFYDSAW